jgi:peptidoglycan/xylan/chitin deacetylase (PgdA/CDA1 family)
MLVTPARFREHMWSLRDAGWRALSLDALLDGRRVGSWPAQSCVVTFDDGLASVAQHAVPVLAACGFPAILFVVADRIGLRANWPGWPADVDGTLMDAAALHDAVAAGCELGAHSASHPRLSRVPPEGIDGEVRACRARIEDATGCRVRSFAYPYGDVDAVAAALVLEHFDAGFSIDLAYATPADPRQSIPRIDTYYLRGRRALPVLESFTMRTYLGVRSFVRRARRAAGSGYGSS